jgi:NADH dehydrogenase (ubiquinone) Fe-S protein 6
MRWMNRQTALTSLLLRRRRCDSDRAMQASHSPDTVRISSSRIACDGATDIPGGAALGHPRVWIELDERGFAECGYCGRRFVLIGGPADQAQAA